MMQSLLPSGNIAIPQVIVTDWYEMSKDAAKSEFTDIQRDMKLKNLIELLLSMASVVLVIFGFVLLQLSKKILQSKLEND